MATTTSTRKRTAPAVKKVVAEKAPPAATTAAPAPATAPAKPAATKAPAKAAPAAPKLRWTIEGERDSKGRAALPSAMPAALPTTERRPSNGARLGGPLGRDQHRPRCR